MSIINGNNPAAIPVAPPLPNSNSASSLHNGAGHGQPQQTITSSGALNQRSTLTPLSPVPGTSSSTGNVSHLPSSPRNLTLPSTVTLHNELEVTNDWSSLNLLHKDIGSRGFRVEKSSDGTVHAIGEKDGTSFDRILSPEEVEGLAAIGSGNDRFVFSGNRGGAGHVMVTAASDFGLAREAIVKKLDRQHTTDAGTDPIPSHNSSGAMEIGTDAQPLPESSSPLKSDPKLWGSLGVITAGLVSLAVTAIVQATALTPAPEEPQDTDPDAAAANAEKAARDQLTQEAYKDPNNQTVIIDQNGNAMPSGDLKDDVLAAIEQQAKAAGEEAKAKAIEDNATAQRNYTEQKEKHDREMLLSSGIGYGISSALILGGTAGLGTTIALHHRNNNGAEQPPIENNSNSFPMNPFGSVNSASPAAGRSEEPDPIYQNTLNVRNPTPEEDPSALYSRVVPRAEDVQSLSDSESFDSVSLNSVPEAIYAELDPTALGAPGLSPSSEPTLYSEMQQNPERANFDAIRSRIEGVFSRNPTSPSAGAARLTGPANFV